MPNNANSRAIIAPCVVATLGTSLLMFMGSEVHDHEEMRLTNLQELMEMLAKGMA